VTITIRSLVTALGETLLRVYFRRIEVSGLSRFPMTGPAIVVLNHPNGLVDPCVLLCRCPRPVSFVAKAPLFDMPFVGTLTRAIDSIPVWRQQDEGAANERTRETVSRSCELLSKGGVLGLFPEGTSHDDPRMKPLKTGAARIALATATGLSASPEPVKIVPAGLFFTDKTAFRSGVLLVFGEPFVVPPPDLEGKATPSPAAVRALTDRIREAIDEVTLQADRDEALSLVAWAEDILEPVGPRREAQTLAEEFSVQRRLLQGYAALKEEKPGEISRLTARIVRHEALAAALGLDPKTLDPASLTAGAVAAATAKTALLALVLLPPAAVGFLVHFPAYQTAGLLADRYAKGDKSLLATTRALAGLLFVPLTWLLAAAVVFSRLGAAPAAVSLAALPACGWAALVLGERFDRFLAAVRAAWLLLRKKRLFLRVVAERREIREAILRLAAEVSEVADAASAGRPPRH
jgi:1-acyl-sn-glycerol-3-phosphate acyltransferase